MIKFLLVLKICSGVHMDCMSQFEHNPLFNNYYECSTVGYLRSLKIMDDMGVDFVNRAEIQVRFKCEKTTES
tara:strand:+ start:42 stop:257 length:216 start_codon:yes stop_codon:yes gene_type:complete